jgi:hypothetical protein
MYDLGENQKDVVTPEIKIYLLTRNNLKLNKISRLLAIIIPLYLIRKI